MVQLENLTSPRARDAFSLAGNIAIVPVGSTEQHGPHLPLGTDHFLASYISRRVAECTNIICTPTIPIGISDHHIQFWGTLTVSPSTLRGYVSDVCTSLQRHGIEKIVIYNCHGGNQSALLEMARRVREKSNLAIFVYPLAGQSLVKFVDDLFGHEGSLYGAHGGAAESSMITAMREDLVDKDAIGVAIGPKKFGTWVYGIDTVYDMIDFTPNGMVGNASEASKEKGINIIEKIVEEVSGFVEWLKVTPTIELLKKSHVD